tara:strand:+ start:335 stop:571 length:237 start_codon:yes stop_codon:yes gene_type:complete
MNSDSKEPNKPRIPDAVDMQRLQRMQTVAKMKDFANQKGMSFVGGYYDEKTGEMFTMDNLPEGFDTSSITDSILPPEE